VSIFFVNNQGQMIQNTIQTSATHIIMF